MIQPPEWSKAIFTSAIVNKRIFLFFAYFLKLLFSSVRSISMSFFSELISLKNGRVVCWMLVIVDIILGGSAVFFPDLYTSFLHPELIDPPYDFIARTGTLWLVFLVFQAVAATRKRPEKWFFLVGCIRLMEVPADIVYAILAIGATPMSRILILSAPVLNSIFGTYLVKLSLQLGKPTNPKQ